jgi:hypothetical protein
MRPHLKQHAGDRLAHDQRDHASDRHASDGQDERASDNHPDDLAPAGAERHAIPISRVR